MARAFLTRRVTFTAAHRYWRPDWTSEENHRVFGESASRDPHQHSYVCEVTLAGEIDPVTGMVADLNDLDQALKREVHDRFDGRYINADVPEFADGMLTPTGENLARYILGRVRAAVGSRAQLTEVTVAEDDTMRCTYRGD